MADTCPAVAWAVTRGFGHGAFGAGPFGGSVDAVWAKVCA